MQVVCSPFDSPIAISHWVRMAMRHAVNSKTDRTWPVPHHPWLMRMTWSELLFAHWPIDPGRVAPLMPAGLTLDTRDGQAWIGVVPFLMSDVAPRCCPAIPKLSRFLELNLRTYVTHDGKPGVWFFSLDAENPLAVRVARTTFHLPYMDATMSMSGEASMDIDYRSERTHRGEPPAKFEAQYHPIGESFLARPGSLEHWLTARYCLYSADRKGRVYRGEIDHPPWTLFRARCQIQHNTLGEAYRFDFSAPPHLLFARAIQVKAWMATRCFEPDPPRSVAMHDASTPLPEGMHPAYRETRFQAIEDGLAWPDEFAIITGYATTGESWTAAENEAADQRLERELRQQSNWVRRLTGYSPQTLHAEPGWAAAIPYEAACDLGMAFRQDAIYYVKKNILSVSFCDARRKPIPLGPFSDRVNVAEG